uniref:Peptidase S1 domain-containing protein n=1 Tax=Strigamia maritima TaxID=126957 RepID=T1JFG5_STRMM
MATYWCVILTIFSIASAQDTSSILGLLSSIASSSTSAECPGECHHAMFSAMFCSKVLEDIDCGSPQQRCCVAADETNENDSLESTTSSSSLRPIPLDTITTTTAVSPLTPISIVTHLTVLDDSKPTSTIPKCPGVCVKPDIALFCGRVIDDDSCINGHKCCTMGETIQSQPLIISQPSTTTTTTTTLKGTVAPTTNHVIIIRGTTPTTSTASTASTTSLASTTEDPTACEGSCVAGFLSLLCDDIDQFGTCPGTQRCCVVRRLVSSTPAGPIKCPGYCMPGLLSGMCNKPARLMPDAIDCTDGTICCDNSGRDLPSPTTVSLPPRPAEFPLFPLLLNAAQALQSSQGSAQGSAQMPMFDQRNPSNFNTDRLDPGNVRRNVCPVPCIHAFLSMTCFGNSVLLENFTCSKDNLVCCVSKNSIQMPPGDYPVRPAHPPPINAQSPPTEVQQSQPSMMTSLSTKKFSCGIKNVNRVETPRIMGGQNSAPGEWCWQVALVSATNQYMCGGALIGTQWVLTAAHCINSVLKSGENYEVRVGVYDFNGQVGSAGAQTIKVSTTYVHHNHNSQTLDNNIALLKLADHAELREGVCLVCLPARGMDVIPGKRCTVTGYGYMGENGPIPLRIRDVELPIVADAECMKKINAVTDRIFVLPTSSFCAGGEEGTDACQGDGGGPMTCEVDGFYELTGIVSWGFGCGRKDVPGVYVKVSSYIGWINQIISINNHHKPS